MPRREKSPPGIGRDILTWLFGSALGLSIAVGWLVLKPVKITDALETAAAEDAQRHNVVYVRGREGPPRSKTWTQKHELFLSRTPCVLDLSEQDLNRWVTTNFAAPETVKTSSGGELTIELPRFHLEGSSIQIGFMSEVRNFGQTARLVVQTRGHFVQHAGKPHFVIESMHVGSCPVVLRALREKIFREGKGLLPASEEFRTAWAQVADVAVADNKMKLAIQ